MRICRRNFSWLAVIRFLHVRQNKPWAPEAHVARSQNRLEADRSRLKPRGKTFRASQNKDSKRLRRGKETAEEKPLVPREDETINVYF